jgi:hypothetical protein
MEIVRCTVQPEEMVPGTLVCATASLRTVVHARSGVPSMVISMVHLRVDDTDGAVILRDASQAGTVKWTAVWVPPCSP